MRFFSAQTGQPRDHWGFAWAPRNLTGIPAAEFAAQSGAVLDRLAAAIRDSGNVVDPASPGSGACGPPGQDVWCRGDLPEARHNQAWRSFRGWTQPVLDFVDPVPTLTAGSPSAPFRLSLVTTSGAPVAGTASTTVTLRSSSPRGGFSTSPAGPWTSTLSLTLAAGSEARFHYLDTRAGTATLTASGPGAATGTQAVTITAGAVARIAVTPASGTVRAQGQRRFTAAGADAYGNAVSSGFRWTVTPQALGTIVPGPGGTATFTAGRLTRTGTILAAADGVVGRASVTVTPGLLRIGSLSLRSGSRRLLITLTTVDGARRPVSNARVSIAVRRDGARHLRARARTGDAGRVRFSAPTAQGCFVVRVTGASAAGFTWDGRTPRNRLCR
jgi:hypothetical protein